MKINYFSLVVLALFSGCALNAVEEKEVKREQIQLEQSSQVVVQEVTLVPEKSLEEKIGSMLMVGFMGTSVSKNSQICKDIEKYNLAGVILFDVNPENKRKPKNILNKQQVAKLTEQLQSCSKDGKLLISVDQEGGKVQRLKSKYGFYGKFPKASDVIKLSEERVKQHYDKMGEELASVGINYNLAPDVDLAINKRNYVIYKLGRSYGASPQQVVKYASLFMDGMHKHGVLTSLKHFPGHGSSLGDTHKGFVDVTNLWQEVELEPYRMLAQRHTIDTVMVAHVFNKRLDAKYPATLSEKIINGKLRGEFGFDGVVITDDLQMGAINQKYGLKNTLKLAINAGNDILLFGNQLSVKSMVKTSTLVNMVKELAKQDPTMLDKIEASNRRLDSLKTKL